MGKRASGKRTLQFQRDFGNKRETASERIVMIDKGQRTTALMDPAFPRDENFLKERFGNAGEKIAKI